MEQLLAYSLLVAYHTNQSRTQATKFDNEQMYYFLKRVMDFAAAVILLLVLLPLLVVIAVAIKLDSPGPVFFIQERVGAKRRTRGGETTWNVQNFRVFKFRTMVANASSALHEQHIKDYVAGKIKPGEGDKVSLKLQNDPRITRVGALLRKTSLDELPQLINVLIGNMSLVGPRPVPTYEVAQYQTRHMERLHALPGITGLWQVKGRCLVEFEDQIALDISYVRARSLWFDIKLLFETIPAVLSGKGAG
jgi:lipopolysaccharide/colanic/teichoic acid biosynthesis glycosyltransferase